MLPVEYSGRSSCMVADWGDDTVAKMFVLQTLGPVFYL